MDELGSLIQKEGLTFEAKRCADRLPSSFWPTYSAFANTFGGRIVLGLSENPDDRKTLTPTGVSDPDKIIRDLWDQANNTQKVSINILTESNIQVKEIDGKTIIVVDIPRAERQKRPVFINDSINNGTYRRNGEGDYHCSMSEIAEMMRDSHESSLDDRLCSKAQISDIDTETFAKYKQWMVTKKPAHPWNKLTTEEYLRVIGAADYDSEGKLKPTFAGILMFSEDYIITKELPEYFLECTIHNPLNNRWNERITSISGEWSGNIFDFISDIMHILNRDSKKPFELDGFVRIDDTDQMKAERELVINALVHADYFEKGGVHVDISYETLEIRNPGSFRIPMAKALTGGYSDPRNKTIMKMLMLIGLVERAGSGLHSVLATCDRVGLPRPTISEDMEPASVTVCMSRLPDMKRQADEDFLSYIRIHGTETLAQMAEGTGLSTSTLSRRLKELKEQGAITRIGGKRAGKWVVKDGGALKP